MVAQEDTDQVAIGVTIVVLLETSQHLEPHLLDERLVRRNVHDDVGIATRQHSLHRVERNERLAARRRGAHKRALAAIDCVEQPHLPVVRAKLHASFCVNIAHFASQVRAAVAHHEVRQRCNCLVVVVVTANKRNDRLKSRNER